MLRNSEVMSDKFNTLHIQAIYIEEWELRKSMELSRSCESDQVLS